MTSDVRQAGGEAVTIESLPPPPYPADTRAKGWRFELDYERIEQSDTWPLAAEIPMAQHALLMLWLVAWTQVPCGSLPNDEAVIRAKCRVPATTWAKCRGVLMRGWMQASDGRLYHATITARVLEMLDYRRKEAERRGRNRGKPPGEHQDDAGTPPDSPPGVPRDMRGTPDTGTGTGTNTSPPPSEKPARKRADPPPDRPADVAEGVWDDWSKLRKAKRAPVTATVVDAARAEAANAGMTLEAFLRVWCIRGSQGLQADWLKPNERGSGGGSPAEAMWRTENRDRNRAYAGPAAAKPKREPETIDADSRLVG